MNQVTDLPKFLGSQTYDVKMLLKEFTKPIFDNIFFNNMSVLYEKAEMVKFDNNTWVMCPHMFCHHFYQEQYLSPVILLANNIGSFLQFIPDNFHNRVIIAPLRSTIIKLLSYV